MKHAVIPCIAAAILLSSCGTNMVTPVPTNLDRAIVSLDGLTEWEKGTISAIYEDSQLGNVIEITHEDGWLTRYGSLETVKLVEVGSHVDQGDIIGSVGATALIESGVGPHLHFELLKNGIFQQPVFE